MTVMTAIVGLALILAVLFEAFETMLLPRRVTRSFRVTRLFYLSSWELWRSIAGLIGPARRRAAFLSYFGPLSLLVLLSFWAFGLIIGFALLQWSLGTPIHGAGADRPDLGIYAYFSGVTYFTLGYGDVTPVGALGRALAVLETGIGFGFIAVVIGYLPVLYQAFSLREVAINLFDARAGSPPTAGTLLARNARYGDQELLTQLLAEWERWAAVLLESQISFPVLSFYRSQHDNQSWVAALTVILDASALVISGLPGSVRSQAYLTFAMARHAAVDLCQAVSAPPVEPPEDRLPPDRLLALRASLRRAGLGLADGADADQRLAELRGMYEPFVLALSTRFLMPMPPLLVEDEHPVDNWQTSAWMRRTRGIGQLRAAEPGDDHGD
jgi:Ion channel